MVLSKTAGFSFSVVICSEISDIKAHIVIQPPYTVPRRLFSSVNPKCMSDLKFALTSGLRVGVSDDQRV